MQALPMLLRRVNMPAFMRIFTQVASMLKLGLQDKRNKSLFSTFKPTFQQLDPFLSYVIHAYQ
jgi:hypothetical protein